VFGVLFTVAVLGAAGLMASGLVDHARPRAVLQVAGVATAIVSGGTASVLPWRWWGGTDLWPGAGRHAQVAARAGPVRRGSARREVDHPGEQVGDAGRNHVSTPSTAGTRPHGAVRFVGQEEECRAALARTCHGNCYPARAL
jgi:hypothetical protein